MPQSITTVLSLTFVLGVSFVHPAFAHGGGLNSDGCHNQRSNGTYHCHRSQRSTPSPRTTSIVGGAFRNCTEARAAGYQNIRRGTYGYGPHLDRDNDGIGCET